MNTFYNLWINLMGYVNIIILLIAGYLIVINNKKIKLLALSLYMINNILWFIRGYIAQVDSFIVGGLIFGTLTIINIIRVYKED